ncbi:rhodanese-like domain-containing protein [Alcaligenaceae bacterium C4P045]|nr:rhodanese-like domain-containing protein [Alcaligenaceae bacterium C4P045]
MTHPNTLAPILSPDDLHTALNARGELAVVDVRDLGVFAQKHLLAATPAPLAHLALVIGHLVPRADTPIVLTDLDESLVHTARERLREWGYSRISILAGGTLAWEAAGFEVFSGVNVLSKAFGEIVEHEAGTPHIDVASLRERIARRDNLVIVDGRTPEEFKNFSLPGAHSVPNAELPYRIRELAPDPDTLIVVNCAGRTRSIIGAQTLIDAGVPNPVVSLKDGTMSWLLDGHTLDQGREHALPEPSAENVAAARLNAATFAKKVGVRTIDDQGLAAFESDAARTLYRFDVRNAAEYRAGHLVGWRWAPGGQLVQATDEYIGTRGARVVLADWDGVRAPTTAAWLAQLGGFEVYLYTPAANAPIETGDTPRRILRAAKAKQAPWIDVQSLHALTQPTAASSQTLRVFDVEKSVAFRDKHIEGAQFAAAGRLPALLADLTPDTALVITSSDGVLAQVVATELLRHGYPARALLGGNRAWFEAHLPTGSGSEHILTGEDDAWHSGYAYTDEAQRHAAFRAYLDWEVGLVEQLRQPGAVTAFNVAGRARDGDLQAAGAVAA